MSSAERRPHSFATKASPATTVLFSMKLFQQAANLELERVPANELGEARALLRHNDIAEEDFSSQCKASHKAPTCSRKV